MSNSVPFSLSTVLRGGRHNQLQSISAPRRHPLAAILRSPHVDAFFSPLGLPCPLSHSLCPTWMPLPLEHSSHPIRLWQPCGAAAAAISHPHPGSKTHRSPMQQLPPLCSDPRDHLTQRPSSPCLGSDTPAGTHSYPLSLQHPGLCDVYMSAANTTSPTSTLSPQTPNLLIEKTGFLVLEALYSWGFGDYVPTVPFKCFSFPFTRSW